MRIILLQAYCPNYGPEHQNLGHLNKKKTHNEKKKTQKVHFVLNKDKTYSNIET